MAEDVNNTIDIPVIEEISFEGVDKVRIRALSYQPPSNEPVQLQIAITPQTHVWITGNYSDLVDIVIDRALLWRDYIRQDSYINTSDVYGNDDVIVIRAGRNDDLAVLYGIVYDEGRAVGLDVLRFYIRDGANINISVDGHQVFIEYGNSKDLHTRFSYYQEDGWRRSPSNNRGGTGYPHATEPVPSARVP